MATSSKGRTSPPARKASARSRGRTNAAASAPLQLPAASSAGSTAVKPPGVVAQVGVDQVTQLRTPLEVALDKLRAALDRATADGVALRNELNTLRAELKQLRQRYESHKHTYEIVTSGGGAHYWLELRFLQKYIDAKKPGFEKYGIWTREKSTSDGSPERKTSGPSG